MMRISFQILLSFFLNAIAINSGGSEIIACGNASLKVSVIQEREDTSVLIEIHNNNGQLIFPQIKHPGAFLPLCRKDRFLLIDNSTHYATTQSFLLTWNGQVIRSFDFGEIVKFGKSDDDEIFWVQRFDIKNQQPITFLIVYDSDGNQLLEHFFEKKTTFQMEKAGKQYKIHVVKPCYPG